MMSARPVGILSSPDVHTSPMKRFIRFALPPLAGVLLGALAMWLLLSRSLALGLAGRGPAGSPPPGEEWTLAAGDGVRRRASAMTAGTGEKWALLLHGRGETGESLAGPGEAYRTRGWSTLIPDLRGCGGSGGKHRGLGVGDGADVLAWMGMIRERHPRAAIVLHGVDLGANAALAAAGERPEGLLAVAADSPVPDLKTQGDRALSGGGKLLEWGVSAFLRRTTGFDLPSLSLRRQTAGTRAPILFLRGEGDDLVPAAEAERLLWIAGKESRLLRLRSGHGDGFRRDRETYLRGLFAFLTGCSGSPQTP